MVSLVLTSVTALRQPSSRASAVSDRKSGRIGTSVALEPRQWVLPDPLWSHDGWKGSAFISILEKERPRCKVDPSSGGKGVSVNYPWSFLSITYEVDAFITVSKMFSQFYLNWRYFFEKWFVVTKLISLQSVSSDLFDKIFILFFNPKFVLCMLCGL